MPDPGAILHFEVKIDSNVDAAQKLIIHSVTIRVKNESRDTELGHLVCACVFSVSNFTDFVMIAENKQVQIEPAFADVLNSISISTTRGVMFSEFKGTALHMALLPLIDVKTLNKVELAAAS